MIHTRSRAIAFVLDHSLLLAGTAAAVAWANLDIESYDAVAHPLHFWVNDIGMVFFFALSGNRLGQHGRCGAADPQGWDVCSRPMPE
jgi:hypothetical protein